jgi:hypothetical protein
MMILYKLLLSSLVAFQVIGPSWVLAIQTSQAFVQGTSKSQALIAGIRGVVTVTPGNNSPGYAPKYRSALAIGDVISTEEESVAEILLENQGLVTIQEYSEIMLAKKADGGLSVTLEVGAIEWSIPLKGSAQTSLTFSTPNIRATTNGGLITAEVQPTLGDRVRKSLPKKSFVVRTSLQAQFNPAEGVALLETFCVKEGTLRVEHPGAQSGVPEQKEVSAGQCVGFFNGNLQAIGDKYQIADWRAICAIGQHCEIPESAKKLIVKKQMRQALALEEALLGSDPDEGEVDEDIILATTGLLLAAALQGPNAPGIGPDPGILPCTGTPEFCAGFAGASPVPNMGGIDPPMPRSGPPSGGGGPPPPVPGNIQSFRTLIPVEGVPGGLGLLAFLESEFMADLELVVADSGILADAPHQGKAPQNLFVVKDLSPDGSGIPSNQNVPIEFGSFPFNFPGLNKGVIPKAQLGTEDVQIGTDPISRRIQLGQLAQFASSPLIDPDNPLASLPGAGDEFPCQLSPGSCLEIILAAGLGGLEPDPKVDSDAGIDAAIQVRSSSTGVNRGVVLKSGVVLVDTTVFLARQQATSDMFAGVGPPIVESTVESSALSFLGNPGEPAIVRFEDRALALLDGSSIQPSPNQTGPTSLLAILDSQFTGPQNPPVIGQDSNGNDILRPDIPPIIEIIDSTAEVETGVVVASTASAGHIGVLDQALLEASTPLLAMIRGTMETTSVFGQIGGKNAKIAANLVPGDALVRLDASSFTVNGNLFNVTGGGQLVVSGGALLSLQGNSIVNINGVLVSVTGVGSLFSLTGGSLVDFGGGTNSVNISNSLCSGGGCFAPFSDPSLMVAGDSASFSAPAGYNPFVDAGTFTDGSVNTVNVTTGSAILEVQQGGSIQIQ